MCFLCYEFLLSRVEVNHMGGPSWEVDEGEETEPEGKEAQSCPKNEFQRLLKALENLKISCVVFALLVSEVEQMDIQDLYLLLPV